MISIMNDKAQKIERAIRLTWSSLESHLRYTHQALPKGLKDLNETNQWHKRCVKEYAEVIKILSELL